MNIFNQNTDATAIYRETSGIKTIRMDRTGDTGSLLGVMRDAVIVLGEPGNPQSQGKIPEHPWGNIDAYAVG